MPPCSDGQNCVLFSDGTSLNAICSIKEVCAGSFSCQLVVVSHNLNAIFLNLKLQDSLVVRQLYTVGCPSPDLMLQLARKSFKTFGYAAFEEELLNQQQIQKVPTLNK